VVIAGVRVDSRLLLWISPVRKTEASRFPKAHLSPTESGIDPEHLLQTYLDHLTMSGWRTSVLTTVYASSFWLWRPAVSTGRIYKLGDQQTSEVYRAVFPARMCRPKQLLSARQAVWRPPRS
jgi:hypothetical protein